LRWTAAGMMEARKGFRRLMAYIRSYGGNWVMTR